MVVPDHEAAYYVAVIPKPQKQGPASMDLSMQTSVTIEPGESVLVATMETIHMSREVCGLVTLRTSTFRRGLALASPGWVDPGFRGQLTVRLINVIKEPITLEASERFIQLILYKMEALPVETYAGKYQNSQGVQGFIPDNE